MAFSSDDDDDDIIFYYFCRRRKKRKIRRFWVHPYIERNVTNRLFIAARELSEDDAKFQTFYRMTKNTFRELVQIVSPIIQRQNNNMRESVSGEERIMITLRYLATGCTFSSLGLYFARGESTVSYIVEETTKAIWESLKESDMPVPTSDGWKTIAARFSELWHLPNCLGAIDGKHIRIQKFPNSGSTNFNYKDYHSVVLLGCCDADGFFTMIDCGFAGRNSDGGIFRVSTFGHWLESANNNIPTASRLLHDESENVFPYYFVADNAFPLRSNIMRPYPERNITNKKKIFNYRLSRGRKTIECSFGMMTQKFQVLLTPIRCRKYNTIISIIKCLCILHNFIRKRDGVPYTVNTVEENHCLAPRNIPNVEENLNINMTSSPQILRDYLANYFLKPRVALPWQWNYCIYNN